MESIIIRNCCSKDAHQWSTFVESQKDATVYHSLAWKDLLVESYGIQPRYLIAERMGTIAGVLPLFLVDNLSGRRLISLPMSMYGGVLCNDKAIFQALLEQVRVLSSVSNASVSVRSWHQQDVRGYNRTLEEIDFLVPATEKNESVHFVKRLKSVVRRAIRKAQRSGLQVKQGNLELVSSFHNLLLCSRRAQGLPCPGRQHLLNLLTKIPGGILCSVSKNKVLGGLLYLDDGYSVYYVFSATSQEGRMLRTADLLLWELLRYTYSEGRRQLYLGGAMPNQEGLLQFKRKWGGVERKMFVYQTQRDTRHSRRKLIGVPLYRHLPLWAARGLGPLIIRWFY